MLQETQMNALREIREFAHKGLVLQINPAHKDYQIIMEIADKAIKDVVLGDYTKNEDEKRRRPQMVENNSGIMPTGHRILVIPDPIEEVTKSGIIVKAIQTVEQERQMAIKGMIVAIGMTAWLEFADGKPWAKVGDRVVCQMRYGIELEGKDGKEYVLFNDQDILAVLEP